MADLVGIKATTAWQEVALGLVVALEAIEAVATEVDTGPLHVVYPPNRRGNQLELHSRHRCTQLQKWSN